MSYKLLLKNRNIFHSTLRNVGHWNKDYKPAPYPKTSEERLASAKKYGILPDEYETYPNDGTGIGDYPKIPAESGDSRDPFYPWDNPELKRNFNEPMHKDVDMMGEDRYDVNFRHRIPLPMQFLQFFVVITTTFLVYVGMEKMKMFPATIPKQYPHTGVTHYTFVLKDKDDQEDCE